MKTQVRQIGRSSLGVVMCACLAGATSLHAFTNMWDGDVSGDWGTAANWTGDAAFAGDIVTFYATGANLATTLGADRNIVGLHFNSDADLPVSIASNNLRIFGADGISVEAGADGDHFIGSTIQITNSQTWAIDTTTGSLTVGPVRGGVNYSVTKTGAGLLWLTNSQIDLGDFIIASGTVRFVAGQGNGFNDNNTRVTVAAGATLDKNNTGTDAFRGLLGGGSILNWTGDLQVRPRGIDNFLFSGTVTEGTAAANLRVVQDANNSFAVLDDSATGRQSFDSLIPFTGQIQVHNGILALQGANGAVPTASRAVIGLNNRASRPTTLVLDNSLDNETFGDRLGDSMGIYFDGPGEFKMVGNWAAPSTETVGSITQNNGRAILTLDAGPGGATILTAADWQMPYAGRVALVRGDNLGTTEGPDVAQFKLVSPPALSHTGGSGDQIGVIPFMVGDTDIAGEGAGLVTYDAATGVRLLTAGEYTGSLTSDRNVKLATVETMTADTTIRALHMDGGVLDLGGHRLFLDSQAIFSGGGTIGNGTILFGTNTTGSAAVGYIHVISNLTLNASIVGTPGSAATRLGIGGPGVLLLGAASDTGPVMLTGGVTLKTSVSDVIVDNQAMAVDQGHLWIGDGLTERTGYLRGGGQSQVTIGTNAVLAIDQGTSDSFYGLLNSPASGTFVKMGTGTLSYRNQATNFFGKVILLGGTFELIDRNGRLQASSAITFEMTNAVLELDSQPGADNANQADRINNESDLYLAAGTINMRGSRNGNTDENVGDLFLTHGMSSITLDRDNSGTPDNRVSLIPNTFGRANRATLFVQGEKLGDLSVSAYSRLAKDNAQPAPVMTHAFASATNTPYVGIVHWAYGQENTAAANGLQDNMGLVTYDDSGTTDPGFRLLRPAEYNINDFSLGGNVWVTNSGGTVGLYSNTTVQGLVYQKGNTAAATVLNLSNQVLWIQSALLANGTNTGSNHEIRRTGPDGALMFGNASNHYEAVIHAARRLDIYVPIMDNVQDGVTNSTTLIKSGPSDVVIRIADGSQSSYSGATYVNNGILRMEGSGAVPYANPYVIPTNTHVYVNNRSAIFEMYNAGQIVGGLYGFGQVRLSSGGNYTNRFVVNYTNTAAPDVFDGWITETAARRNLDLVKTGDGTLVLTTYDRTNSYKGTTFVEAGELRMNGVHLSPSNSANYVVRTNAILSGSGLIRVPGGVAVEDGGKLAPGDDGAGTLTIETDLTLAPRSVLAFELNGADTTVGGGVSDLLTGVNNLILEGTLEVAALASFAGAQIGDTWTLIQYSGSLGANTLVISDASQALLYGEHTFAVDDDTDGEIRLTIIPEPHTLGLLLIGLAAARRLLLRRR